MDLTQFVKRIAGFGTVSHSDKIKLFGWFLHTEKTKHDFKVADIRECYDQSHFDPPANLTRLLDALAEKTSPELLKKPGGLYRLHANVRTAMDTKYGSPDSVIVVEAALADLPAKLNNPSERLFLNETLTCYRHKAYRAAIVMAWNLTYDHLLHWVLADVARLAAFNQGIVARNSKKVNVTIQVRADFEKFGEDEVIDIAATLSGITANMKRSLKEKLGRRNTYAHPSNMHAERQQVDDMILDLVNNIVVKLPW